MNFKRLVILLLVLGLTVTICGCNAIDVMKGLVSGDEPEVEIIRSDGEDLEASTEVNMRNTVLYFQNENGYLIPVKREIPWEEGIAKAALYNMIDSPMINEDIAAVGLRPIIPSGTEVLGMTVKEDGLCKVDFTRDILNYSSQKEEENLIKGIVYTLTEFPTIDEVQFMFEGEVEDRLQYGTQVGEGIKREDINLLSSIEESHSKVVVYYKGTSNGEYEYYVPVTVPTAAPAPSALTALNELFNGPPAYTGLYTDIPLGVYLQDIEVKDGIAFIDLILDSEDAIASQRAYDLITKNIGLTLGEFEDVLDVEVLIDGETVEEAGLDFSDTEGIPVFANEY